MPSIFLVYTARQRSRACSSSPPATFGAMSLYGYTTKRDLTGLGSFLFMGLIGIVIATLVNIFLASLGAAVRDLGDRRARLHRPHRLRHAEDQGDVLRRATTARRGRARRSWARCRLYLDFINLFLMLLPPVRPTAARLPAAAARQEGAATAAPFSFGAFRMDRMITRSASVATSRRSRRSTREQASPARRPSS